MHCNSGHTFHSLTAWPLNPEPGKAEANVQEPDPCRSTGCIPPSRSIRVIRPPPGLTQTSPPCARLLHLLLHFSQKLLQQERFNEPRIHEIGLHLFSLLTAETVRLHTLAIRGLFPVWITEAPMSATTAEIKHAHKRESRRRGLHF